MKVSTENDNNFGYEKITIVVDNIPLRHCINIVFILQKNIHVSRERLRFVSNNQNIQTKT
jgi:hypothetical protein